MALVCRPSSNERMPTFIPRFLHLGLSKHVVRIVSRLRLHAHTSKVEAAARVEVVLAYVRDQFCNDYIKEYKIKKLGNHRI